MGRSLAVSTVSPLAFGRCLTCLRQSLSRSGFHVLAEIPFEREFRNHLGLVCKRYTVLVVWSPFHAYQAILSEQEAGVLMPFHLIVAEGSDGTHIFATDIAMLGHLSGQLGIELLGREINCKVQDIYSELGSHAGTQASTGRRGEKPG